jgi:hypothetical protein
MKSADNRTGFVGKLPRETVEEEEEENVKKNTPATSYSGGI